MKAPKIIGIAACLLAASLLFSGLAFSADKSMSIDLPQTAKDIAAGKIDVGKTPDVEIGNRFHNIHNKVLGLECGSCHIRGYAPDYLLITRDKAPEGGSPGVIDRGMCLSCHKENGPAATKLYGSEEN